MKRKPLVPRNPLVQVALFKKAGAHQKTNKANRRALNVETRKRGCSSVGRASGFYPDCREFDPRRPHQ